MQRSQSCSYRKLPYTAPMDEQDALLQQESTRVSFLICSLSFRFLFPAMARTLENNGRQKPYNYGRDKNIFLVRMQSFS